MPNSAIAFNTAGLASATSPGLVGTGSQTFAGDKTFNGLVSASSGIINTGLTGANATTVTTSGSGKVGETVVASFSGIAAGSMPLAGTTITLATLALTPGVWNVVGKVTLNITATTASTDPYVAAGLALAAVETGATINLAQFSTGQATYRTCMTQTTLVTTAGNSTIYLTARHGASTLGGATFSGSGIGVTSSHLYAVRIA